MDMTTDQDMEALYQGIKIEAGKYKVAMRRESPPRLMTGIAEGIHPDRNMTFQILKERPQAQPHILDSGYWGVYGSLGEYPCSEIELGIAKDCVLK